MKSFDIDIDIDTDIDCCLSTSGNNLIGNTSA